LMVESCEDSLMMDSSRTEVCSGVDPCFEGNCARDSFSTYQFPIQLANFLSNAIEEYNKGFRWCKGATYSNLKIHLFLGKRWHFIVKAEAILANIVCREYKIALSLLGTLHDEFLIGSCYGIVDIEGTSGLNL
jgi:hypothetical protein